MVSQIALAFMLLAGAGLLGISLRRAMDVSPGFRADHILTGKISLPWKSYSDANARVAFTEKLVDKIGQLPGVVSAGVVTNVPLSGVSGKSSATILGRVAKPGESPRSNYSYGVGGDYFKAMSFTLREGRFLTEADSRSNLRVCVVDEDFARYYWPGGSALGHRLFEGGTAGKDDEAFTIVGVVGSVKQAGLTEEAAQGAVYYPYAFHSDDFFVAVRTSLPPEALGLTLQGAVRQADPRFAGKRCSHDGCPRCRQPCRSAYTCAACGDVLGNRTAADRHRQLWRVELRCRTTTPQKSQCGWRWARSRGISATNSFRSHSACWPTAWCWEE